MSTFESFDKIVLTINYNITTENINGYLESPRCLHNFKLCH